jgi:hypothetical protein
MERYVQGSDRELEALELADVRRDPLRQRNSPSKDPDECEPVEARGVSFQYLVRDPA